ncbi:MAG: adenylate kinase [Chloroflexota bacterium]|nr:MAG: adenylate kinase [Chloroflexota bacterium]
MNSQPLHLLLFGPPGAGKSTQTEFLETEWKVAPISTGALLRAQVAAHSELGKQVSALLARGELASDEIIIPLLRARLAELSPDEGFLLDGFPRTIPQAEALDKILTELNRPLDAVISLELGTTEAVNRLGGRRICHGNGPDEIIHINDEAAVARCIERGGLLVQRPDDLPNVIVRRLAVYQTQTEPLLNFYRPRGIVRTIDASGSPQEVARRVTAAIQEIHPLTKTW